MLYFLLGGKCITGKTKVCWPPGGSHTRTVVAAELKVREDTNLCEVKTRIFAKKIILVV